MNWLSPVDCAINGRGNVAFLKDLVDSNVYILNYNIMKMYLAQRNEPETDLVIDKDHIKHHVTLSHLGFNLGADALLLFSSTKEIRGFYIHKQVYYVVARNVDRAVGVAYDGRHIYWTDLVSEEEAILRSNEDGSNVEIVVNAGKYFNITDMLLVT